MRDFIKWLGAAIVVFGIACFPMAIWFKGPWGVISLLLVIAGCFLLVGTMRGLAPQALETAEEEAEAPGGAQAPDDDAGGDARPR